MKQLLNGELKNENNDQFLLVQQDHAASSTIAAMHAQAAQQAAQAAAQAAASQAMNSKPPEEFPSASFSCEQSCPKDHEQHERKCGIPVILCTKTGKILRRVETP